MHYKRIRLILKFGNLPEKRIAKSPAVNALNDTSVSVAKTIGKIIADLNLSANSNGKASFFSFPKRASAGKKKKVPVKNQVQVYVHGLQCFLQRPTNPANSLSLNVYHFFKHSLWNEKMGLVLPECIHLALWDKRKFSYNLFGLFLREIY